MAAVLSSKLFIMTSVLDIIAPVFKPYRRGAVPTVATGLLAGGDGRPT
jgi:hypothetical protein